MRNWKEDLETKAKFFDDLNKLVKVDVKKAIAEEMLESNDSEYITSMVDLYRVLEEFCETSRIMAQQLDRMEFQYINIVRKLNRMNRILEEKEVSTTEEKES